MNKYILAILGILLFGGCANESKVMPKFKMKATTLPHGLHQYAPRERVRYLNEDLEIFI